MSKYVLECPRCEARFELRKYAPDKRVHCRKCRAVVIIPSVPGAATGPAEAGKPLNPRLQEKLTRVFSLRKLALVSLLLAVALAGGFTILIKKSDLRAPAASKKPPEKMTLEGLAKANHALAFPLGAGYSWEYELSGGVTETRRVLTVAPGMETEEPEAEFVQPGLRQTFRVTSDGVYLLSEIGAGGKRTLSKPMLWVPVPMYTDSSWEYEGEALPHGAPPEKWKLAFKVQRLEALDWGAGRKSCFLLHVQGEKAGAKIEEFLWYSNGTGLVKRMSKLDGRVEEAKLTRFSKK